MSKRPGVCVDLVLLWHQHQPDYRDPHDGRAMLPWVRLHASKDYLDMAYWLDRHPGVHATVNFVPSLVDQLEASERGGSDALFDLLARSLADLEEDQRREVLWRCAMLPPYAHGRWPAVQSVLSRVAGRDRGEINPSAFHDRELLTLQCGFLLGWLDPTLHAEEEAAEAIAALGRLTEAHRDGLLRLHGRLPGRVVPAYCALQERGQIELSTTPYNHPILPLLVTTDSSERARPDLPRPVPPFNAPEDAVEQIRRALARHAQVFGSSATGMWPSEGSVSPEVARLAAGEGVRWLASDEGVLWRSLDRHSRADLYRPWRLDTESGSVALFFRDHDLSDRIGFVYRHVPAGEAVQDFLARLRRIGHDHARSDGLPPTVCVFLDGENCWEHYADDGGPFLETLYRSLQDAPDIRTRTPSEVLNDHGELRELERLHSGSWIDADFHIWIGHAEKNRGWELLRDVRTLLVDAGTSADSHPDAWNALYAAEGSDWFWWFGDDHQTVDKQLFDRIFRAHLEAACEKAGLAVPHEVRKPIVPSYRRRRTDSPMGFVRPKVDGRVSNFFEWSGAGRHDLHAGGDSMHRAGGLTRAMYHGFDATRLAIRLDFDKGAPGNDVDLLMELHAPHEARMRVRGLGPGASEVVWELAYGAEAGDPVRGAEACVDQIFELVVPFKSIGLEPGQSTIMVCRLMREGATIETIPPGEALRFDAPDHTFERRMWWV